MLPIVSYYLFLCFAIGIHIFTCYSVIGSSYNLHSHNPVPTLYHSELDLPEGHSLSHPVPSPPPGSVPLETAAGAAVSRCHFPSRHPHLRYHSSVAHLCPALLPSRFFVVTAVLSGERSCLVASGRHRRPKTDPYQAVRLGRTPVWYKTPRSLQIYVTTNTASISAAKM